MGLCVVCQRPAGFLKYVHPECEPQAVQINEMEGMLSEWLNAPTFPLEKLLDDLKPFGTPPALKQSAARVFAAFLDRVIADRQKLDMQRMGLLASFAGVFTLPQVLTGKVWKRFVMLVCVAELETGVVPNRCDDPGIGFRYLPGERPVWVFGGAQHWKNQVHRSAARYAGLSWRLAPGLYARTGMALPQHVTEGLEAVSEGNLVITNHALWYQGPNGVLHIPLRELVYVECAEHGIVFSFGHRGMNEAFMTGEHEGWFAHALVSGLISLC